MRSPGASLERRRPPVQPDQGSKMKSLFSKARRMASQIEQLKQPINTEVPACRRARRPLATAVNDGTSIGSRRSILAGRDCARENSGDYLTGNDQVEIFAVRLSLCHALLKGGNLRKSAYDP